CDIGAIVKFIPHHNPDKLFGIIVFSEVLLENQTTQTQVDGAFTTPIGLKGLKTEDGNYIYTVELFHDNEKVCDLTEPVFSGATIYGHEPKAANLTICGKNSIIGKTVVIKKEEEEIATANIVGLEAFDDYYWVNNP
ncbi:5092_t:CDS:1, partial [Cetraspora pellucida]